MSLKQVRVALFVLMLCIDMRPSVPSKFLPSASESFYESQLLEAKEENERLRVQRDAAIDQMHALKQRLIINQRNTRWNGGGDEWERQWMDHLIWMKQRMEEMESILMKRNSKKMCLQNERETAKEMMDSLSLRLRECRWTNSNLTESVSPILVPTKPASNGQCLPCKIYESLDELRAQFGSNEAGIFSMETVYGSMGAAEARRLYHFLLPECIASSQKYRDLRLCQKAKKAFLSRKTIKKYIRERTSVWASGYAKMMDFVRHWSTDGASDIALWNKKAKKLNLSRCVIRSEDDERPHSILWNDAKCKRVCELILKSSIKTNELVDAVVMH